jgi:hypothetical protein
MRAWLATRKGLFELQRRGGGWDVARISFLAEPVSMLLPPDADGFMLAALNLGHFGVKLHASDDFGAHWREVSCPQYPEQPDEPPQPFPWKLGLIWSLERSVDGRLWCGTLPGGLFVSSDRAQSWQLVEGLWNRPERLGWFGGGYPEPGIHSICPHPTDAADLLVAVSCAGVWRSRDAGVSWQVHCKGLRADFLPPEQAEDPNGQDPHRVQRCAAAPEVLWMQHHCGIWRSDDHAQVWRELRAQPSSFGFAVAAHPSDPEHRLVRPGGEGHAARAGGRRAVRDPHARRRAQLRGAARGAAAAALLRPRLPPWARGGGRRPDPADGLDDRQFVDQLRRR